MRERGKGWITAHEEAGRYWLQIDLQNDFAITLTYPKNGGEPRCTLWRGNGETDLDDYDLERFREFCEIALGNRSEEQPHPD
jgi:hypothetical protein